MARKWMEWFKRRRGAVVLLFDAAVLAVFFYFIPEMRRPFEFLMIALFGGLTPASEAWAIRIKELATFEGVRSNQIYGYGLVVGLNGTGDKDKTYHTNQALNNFLKRMDITIPVNPKDMKIKNVAAVAITADLPPFIKPGSKIDVLVSSIGDSTSLQGGTLIVTPLISAGDGKIYAVAQGPLSVGGFSITGQAGSVQKNHPTVGRVVQGATVEREVPIRWQGKEAMSLKLDLPDFTTAARVAEAVNSRPPGASARPTDAPPVGFNVPMS